MAGGLISYGSSLSSSYRTNANPCRKRPALTRDPRKRADPDLSPQAGRGNCARCQFFHTLKRRDDEEMTVAKTELLLLLRQPLTN